MAMASERRYGIQPTADPMDDHETLASVSKRQHLVLQPVPVTLGGVQGAGQRFEGIPVD